MTYRNNFVAVVKCRGAILREHDGVVTIPFGSDYSLLLKNLDDRKATVDVSIDGESVTENRSLVVYPNSTMELEGFMKGGTVRNRFRFVQKTDEVVAHRGDRIDDGIVRVEFTFEKRVETVEHVHHHHTYHEYHSPVLWWDWYNWPGPWHWRNPVIYCNDSHTKQTVSGTRDIHSVTASMLSGNSVNASLTDGAYLVGDTQPVLNQDEGITVAGSPTTQVFTPVTVGELEENSTVITIRLVGTTTSGAPAKAPVTTKTRLECPTCGRSAKSDSKFCAGCGTCLV